MLTQVTFGTLQERKIYKFCKKFDFECFNISLTTKLDSIKSSSCNEFDEALCSVLNIHAPLKQACPNCAYDADQVQLGAQNSWGAPNFLHILPCKKSSVDLQTSSQIVKIMKIYSEY